MISLPNGCRLATMTVIPKNWKSSKASTKTNWRIVYRFYDPRFPKPKQIVIAGMNRIKDLKERQSATMALIDQETALILAGFNPFDGNIPDMITAAIAPQMPFADALFAALQKVNAVKGTLIDMKSVVKGSIAAAKRLNIDRLPINQVGRRHIKMMLEDCRQHNPRFSNHRFNKYKAYLTRLFRELIEMELIETNPVRDIAKAKETKAIRETVTPNDLKIIDALKESQPAFWRYMKIFFFSGCRTTELFRIRREDVRIDNQEMKVLVKKGNSYREEIRAVHNEVVELWRALIAESAAGDYLFSKGLKPGPKQIRPDQINRRWNRYVKKGLGIDKDFYTLKHCFADQVATVLDIDHAATADGHSTPVITLKHYATGEKKRQRDRIKSTNIKFG